MSQEYMFDEYWIGKDIDIKYLKLVSEEGYVAFVQKIKNNYEDLVILSIQFEKPNARLPLIEHELIYKAFKRLFHDFKELTLSEDEYDNALPIFLYEINRGSATYEWVIEAGQIASFISFLAIGYKYILERVKDHHEIKNLSLNNKKLELEVAQMEQTLNGRESSNTQICRDIIINQNILTIDIRELRD